MYWKHNSLSQALVTKLFTHIIDQTHLEIDGRVVAGNEPLNFRPGEEAEPVKGNHGAEPVPERGNLDQSCTD